MRVHRRPRENRKDRRRRLRKNIILFLTISCLLVVLGSLAFHFQWFHHRKHAHQNPLVQTECGPIQGVKEQLGASSAIVFKGIPFAKPPVGELRWKTAKRLDKASCWTGVLKADRFKHSCYQFDLFEGRNESGREDCLYLDIWTPEIGPTKRLPVAVFIHGGSLMFGSSHTQGASPNVEFVSSMNVVAVSISYRVNTFGFLALDVLSRQSQTRTSGNYGFMDQIMALNWVKANIAQFGGDPAKATVVGQGSGGTSIYGLLASRKANGLFSKAIVMSGSAVFSKTTKEASKNNEIFLKNSKCDKKNDKETLKCLYRLNASEVLQATPWSSYQRWRGEVIADLPTKGLFDEAVCVVDGDVVTTPPALLKNIPTMSSKVAVMIGTTAQETAFLSLRDFTKKPLSEFVNYAETRLGPFSAELPKRAVNQYIMALNSSKPELLFTTMSTDLRVTCPNDNIGRNLSTVDNLTVYRYVVTNRPKHPARFTAKPTIYSVHLWDLAALFGFHHMPYGYRPTEQDRHFRDAIRKAFSRFMETGKPGGEKWMTYPSRVGIFGNERLKVQINYHQSLCELWNEYNMFDYGWIN